MPVVNNKSYFLRKPDSLNFDWTPLEAQVVPPITQSAGRPSMQRSPVSRRSPIRPSDSLMHSLCPKTGTDNEASSTLTHIRRVPASHQESISQGMLPTKSTDDVLKVHRRIYSRSPAAIDRGSETMLRGKGCINGPKGEHIVSQAVQKCLWQGTKNSPDLTDASALLARRRPAPAHAVRTNIGNNAVAETNTYRPGIRCLSPDIRLIPPLSPCRIRTMSQRQEKTSFIDHMNMIPPKSNGSRCVSTPRQRGEANPNTITKGALDEPIRRKASTNKTIEYAVNPIIGINVNSSNLPTPLPSPRIRRSIAPTSTISLLGINKNDATQTTHHRSASVFVHNEAPFARYLDEKGAPSIHTGRRTASMSNNSILEGDTTDRSGKRFVRRAVSPAPISSQKIGKLRPKIWGRKENAAPGSTTTAARKTQTPKITPRPARKTVATIPTTAQ